MNILAFYKKVISSCRYNLNWLRLKVKWIKRFDRTKKYERKLSRKELKEYKNYWSNISSFGVSARTLKLVKGLSGVFDKRIVPEELFALDIEPALNHSTEIPFFENKSVIEKWIGISVFPKSYIHNIDGVFYDSEFHVISDLTSFYEEHLIHVNECIAKPNKDTFGGKGVVKLKSPSDIKKYLLSQKKNYVIQEIIYPHIYLSKVTDKHPVSLRVCTYRSFFDNKVKVLNTTLRMGVNGSLDNASDGGIYVNINENGAFSSYALNIVFDRFTEHPNSRFIFKEGVIPMYNELIEKCVDVAEKIPFARLLSFDAVLDIEENWRFFEVNILGQTIRFAQNFGIPFFGEYTEDVLTFVKNVNKKE